MRLATDVGIASHVAKGGAFRNDQEIGADNWVNNQRGGHDTSPDNDLRCDTIDDCNSRLAWVGNSPDKS